MKKKFLATAALAALAFSLTACGGTNTPPPADDSSSDASPTAAGAASGYSLVPKDTNGDGFITLGFAQVGAESGWRTANTQSYKDYFVEANGFKLVFLDANQDADKQKQDVRDLIAQGVEVIDLAPVTDSGWEPVLQEAKDAGIPLIVSDRQLSVSDDLYLTYFGGNMEEEGKTAVKWLQDYITANNVTDPINILHLQGTIGSTAQKGRTKALDDAAPANDWNIVFQQTGEFTQAKGQEVTESFLQQGKDFNVIYSENDDMTYGAIDALRAAGKDPKEYIIISFDGNKSAVQMVVDGLIDVIAECDPLLGPQVGDLIKKAEAGEQIAKITYSNESYIDSTNAAEKVKTAFGS
ncbi:MAG: ABC transporter substrate-binding protein [Propionibacteriaceae bacterium]|jgi:simple sugar transport system substrate-binding protein|nr:ABC transporter substrate-binding protein [Propionibacteriaceae bacterium]